MDSEVEESSEEDLQPRTSLRPTPAPFCQPPFTPSVPEVSLIFNDELTKNNSSHNVSKNSTTKPPAGMTLHEQESYNAWKYKNSQTLQESARDNSRNISPAFKHYSPLPNYSLNDYHVESHNRQPTVSRISSTYMPIENQPKNLFEQTINRSNVPEFVRKECDVSFGMAPLQPSGYAIPKHGLPTDSFQRMRSPNLDHGSRSSNVTSSSKNFNNSPNDKIIKPLVEGGSHRKSNAYDSFLNTTSKNLMEHSRRPVVNSPHAVRPSDGRDPRTHPETSARSDYIVPVPSSGGSHLPIETHPGGNINPKSRFGTARTINYVETYQQVQKLPLPLTRQQTDVDDEQHFRNREIQQQLQHYNRFISPLSYQNYPSEYGNQLPQDASLENFSRGRHSLVPAPFPMGVVQHSQNTHIPHSARHESYYKQNRSLAMDPYGQNQHRERRRHNSGGNRLQKNSSSVASEQFHDSGDVALNRRSKATVHDLFKIVQLQNEQLQLLQAQVSQLMSNQMKQSFESALQECSRGGNADNTRHSIMGNTPRSVGEDQIKSSGRPRRLAAQLGDNDGDFNPNVYQRPSETRADRYRRPKQVNPLFPTNTRDSPPQKLVSQHRSDGGNGPHFANSETNTSLLWDKNMRFPILGGNVVPAEVESDRYNKPTNIAAVCQKVSIGVMTSFIDPMFGNAGNAVQQIHETRQEFVQHGPHPDMIDNSRVVFDDAPTLPQQMYKREYRDHGTQPRVYDKEENLPPNRSPNKMDAQEEYGGQQRLDTPIAGAAGHSREDSHSSRRPMQHAQISSNSLRHDLLSGEEQGFVHQTRAASPNPEEYRSTTRLAQQGQVPADYSRRSPLPGEFQNRVYQPTDMSKSKETKFIQNNVRPRPHSGGRSSSESQTRGIGDRFKPQRNEGILNLESGQILTAETQLKDLWTEKDACQFGTRHQTGQQADVSPRETQLKEYWTSGGTDPGQRLPLNPQNYGSNDGNAMTDSPRRNIDNRKQVVGSNVPTGRQDTSGRRHHFPESPPLSESPESASEDQDSPALHRPIKTFNVLDGLERLAPFESLSDQVDESLCLADLDMGHVSVPQPTPVPSVHISIGEYKMSDEEQDTSLEGEARRGEDSEEEEEKVGWTFYHNMMGQVNQMLVPSARQVPQQSNNVLPTTCEVYRNEPMREQFSQAHPSLQGTKHPQGTTAQRVGQDSCMASTGDNTAVLTSRQGGNNMPTMMKENLPMRSQSRDSETPVTTRQVGTKRHGSSCSDISSQHQYDQPEDERKVSSAQHLNTVVTLAPLQQQVPNNQGRPTVQKFTMQELVEQSELENYLKTAEHQDAMRNENQHPNTRAQHPESKKLHPITEQHLHPQHQLFGRRDDHAQQTADMYNHPQQSEQYTHQPVRTHRSRYDQFVNTNESRANVNRGILQVSQQRRGDGQVTRDSPRSGDQNIQQKCQDHVTERERLHQTTARQDESVKFQDHLNQGIGYRLDDNIDAQQRLSPRNRQAAEQYEHRDQTTGRQDDRERFVEGAPLNTRPTYTLDYHENPDKNSQPESQRYPDLPPGNTHPDGINPNAIQQHRRQPARPDGPTPRNNQQRYLDQPPGPGQPERQSPQTQEQGYNVQTLQHEPHYDTHGANPQNVQLTNQRNYYDQAASRPYQGDAHPMRNNGQANQRGYRDQPPGHEQPHGNIPRNGQPGRRSLPTIRRENNGRNETVRQATLEQLQQMGISFYDQSGAGDGNYLDDQRVAAAYFPRMNVNATELTESSDVSMRMNALALKYLKDDQLGEYTRMAASAGNIGEGMTVCNIATKSTNLSFASMSYLERYQLVPPTQHPPGS